MLNLEIPCTKIVHKSAFLQMVNNYHAIKRSIDIFHAKIKSVHGAVFNNYLIHRILTLELDFLVC